LPTEVAIFCCGRISPCSCRIQRRSACDHYKNASRKDRFGLLDRINRLARACAQPPETVRLSIWFLRGLIDLASNLSNAPLNLVGLNAVDLEGSTGTGFSPAGVLQSVNQLAARSYKVTSYLAGKLRNAPAQKTQHPWRTNNQSRFDSFAFRRQLHSAACCVGPAGLAQEHLN
jgi:hypothetical protein